MTAALPVAPPTTGINLNASRQAELRGTTIAVTLLALLFVILRFIARVTKGAGVGKDDWVLLVALVFLFAVCGLNLMMIEYGLGRHAAVLSVDQMTGLLKVLVVFECVYCTTVGIIKISLLLMYGRIFTLRWFRMAAYIVAMCTIGWVIAINFVSIFQCTPIKKAWLPFEPGTCIDLKASFIGNGVPNFVTDIIILTLPMPIVWKLHTSLSHRLSLSFVFLLGSFVVFASIYRFITIFQFNPIDTSWTLATACTWCVVECAAGIISACLPTLRPLLKSFTSKFDSTRQGKSLGHTTPHANSAGRELVTIGGSEIKKGGNGQFVKLDDSGALRSKNSKHTVTVATIDEGSRGDSREGDEVPLNVINVRRDVDLEWSANSTHEGSVHEDRRSGLGYGRM
ncbi:hypothetical protein EDC01DRAFT_784708 [Geopyxis carbonaria]|nr:hypothetical protein EDC01DRAFT_784708 [Geopyxis carbonaria]